MLARGRGRIAGDVVSYCVFTIEEVKRHFLLRLEETCDLLSRIPPAEMSGLLRKIFKEYVRPGLAIAMEKTRSEIIIAPVLIAARREIGGEVRVFSGVVFTVNPKQRLSSVCGFLLSQSRGWTLQRAEG